MYYLDKLKHLLVMERDSKRFKVYNSKTGKWMFSVPEKSTGEGGPQRCTVPKSYAPCRGWAPPGNYAGQVTGTQHIYSALIGLAP